MSGDGGITTLTMRLPPGEATRCIRRALAAGGLTIASEMDLGTRLSGGFRIRFPHCHVLCVVHPPALLEALTFDRSAAVLLPLHVVVAEQEGATVVQLLNPSAALYGVLPVSARAAVSKIFSLVMKTLEEMSPRVRAAGTTAG